MSLNFRVFVRSRVPSGSDNANFAYSVTAPNEIARVDTKKTYKFDRVFDANTDQLTVFEKCALPLVIDLIKGFNCTLFAYGATGTGKTYTMTGVCDSPETTPEAGIVPRVFDAIFHKLANGDEKDWLIEIEFLQLYNEELHDLLDTRRGTTNPTSTNGNPNGHTTSTTNNTTSNNGSNRRLELPVPLNRQVAVSKHPHARPAATATSLSAPRRHQLAIVETAGTKSSPKSVEVPKSTKRIVSSFESAMDVVNEALKGRATSATALNAQSSRSHAVLTIILVRQDPVSGKTVRSKLRLVDLAGSEHIARSGARNQQAQEAGNINKSLLTLGTVFMELAELDKMRQRHDQMVGNLTSDNSIPTSSSRSHLPLPVSTKHISYRSSKLTHLLQDSLGGTTKTCMIATVNLDSSDAEMSQSTLVYASHARGIRNETQYQFDVMEKPTTLQGFCVAIDKLQHALDIQRRQDRGVFTTLEDFNRQMSAIREAAVLRQEKIEVSKQHSEALEACNAENARLRAVLVAKDAELAEACAAASSHSSMRVSMADSEGMLAKFLFLAEDMQQRSHQERIRLEKCTASVHSLLTVICSRASAHMLEQMRQGMVSQNILCGDRIVQGSEKLVNQLLDQFREVLNESNESIMCSVREYMASFAQQVNGSRETLEEMLRVLQTIRADVVLKRQKDEQTGQEIANFKVNSRAMHVAIQDYFKKLDQYFERAEVANQPETLNDINSALQSMFTKAEQAQNHLRIQEFNNFLCDQQVPESIIKTGDNLKEHIESGVAAMNDTSCKQVESTLTKIHEEYLLPDQDAVDKALDKVYQLQRGLSDMASQQKDSADELERQGKLMLSRFQQFQSAEGPLSPVRDNARNNSRNTARNSPIRNVGRPVLRPIDGNMSPSRRGSPKRPTSQPQHLPAAPPLRLLPPPAVPPAAGSSLSRTASLSSVPSPGSSRTGASNTITSRAAARTASYRDYRTNLASCTSTANGMISSNSARSLRQTASTSSLKRDRSPIKPTSSTAPVNPAKRFNGGTGLGTTGLASVPISARRAGTNETASSSRTTNTNEPRINRDEHT